MQQLGLFIPESSWTAPRTLPDIPAGSTIAVDTETRDNGLAREMGAGWTTGDGHVAGFSVAWGERACYVSLRHPDSDNFELSQAYGWLEEAMRRSKSIVFHNSTYDTGWLKHEGVTIPHDRCEDTQHAAVMLGENELSYDLNACCRRAGLPGKDERLLREAAAAYGCDPKKDLWKLPAKFVGPYCEQDTLATLRLWEFQRRKLREEDLEKAYRLEMDLVPCMHDMMKRGVRVDEDRVERTQKSLRQKKETMLADLRRQLGFRRELTVEDVNSPDMLSTLFDAEGLQYPRTPKTRKGSFKKGWLESHEHWLPRAVTSIRKMDGFAEKFLGTYILDNLHLGRVHADIHQLRDDEGGTRSYRLSYSTPPLQQIPARDPLAPLIRASFLPESGELWGAADYSQQEPRMAVHFAAACRVLGADAAVDYYMNDPGADFHTMVAELTGLKRKQAKIINLGLMYGMGIDKLAVSLGVSVEEAKEIVQQYIDRMPWVKQLEKFCASRSQDRGYIRLLDGARCRFDQWELAWRGDDFGFAPTSYEEALRKANGKRIKRSGTHKAMNRLVQGSSARQTKMAMLECYREGLTMLIQMHDEIDFSFSSPDQATRVAEIMENVVPLKIPMKVDMQLGWDWGQASEELDDKEFPKGTPMPSWDEMMSLGRDTSNADIVRRRAA